MRTAVEMCAEHGFTFVTMDRVAAEAGVGKPTLYRWWPSKAHLMLDALLEEVSGRYFLIPDTGDIREDLRSWLRGFVALFVDPLLRALCVGVASAQLVDADLREQMILGIHAPAREHNQARIRGAQAAGQLPDTDPQLIEDCLIGPLWYRVLISGMPVTDAVADEIVQRQLG